MLQRVRARLAAWKTKLQLLVVLQVAPGDGEVFVGGERMVLVPARMLNETRERLVGIGPAAQRFMYEAGKEAGYAYAKAVENVGKDVQDPAQFSELCAGFGRFTGWGNITIVEEDFDEHVFTVRLEHTLFVNDRDETTGEYHAGNLAGAASYVLGTDMDAKEVTCENQGEAACTFTLREADELGSVV